MGLQVSGGLQDYFKLAAPRKVWDRKWVTLQQLTARRVKIEDLTRIGEKTAKSLKPCGKMAPKTAGSSARTEFRWLLKLKVKTDMSDAY